MNTEIKKNQYAKNKIVLNTYRLENKTFKGKEYLVVPVVIITEGVLNNILYNYYAMLSSTNLWNGIPVVINHPEDGFSANKPEVLEEQGVGFLYNTTFQENEMKKGQLKSEIWFDRDELSKLAPDILERVKNLEMIEVSTGLMLDLIWANGSEFSGKSFQFVGEDFKPDHLAILPYEKGSCSIADGCGIRTNKENMLKSNVKVSNENSLDIHIYAAIVDNKEWWFGADEYVIASTVVKKIDNSKAETINVFINSPGGTCSAGMAIYNSLKRSKAKVIINVDGIAASAASVIAMAGDEIVMPKVSIMMIHNALNCACGEASELRKVADELDTFTKVLTNAYLEKTNKSYEEVKKMMNDVTYLSGEECVAMGFATKLGDSISENEQAENELVVGNKHYSDSTLKMFNIDKDIILEKLNRVENGVKVINNVDSKKDKEIIMSNECNCPEMVNKLIESKEWTEEDRIGLNALSKVTVTNLLKQIETDEVKNEETSESEATAFGSEKIEEKFGSLSKEQIKELTEALNTITELAILDEMSKEQVVKFNKALEVRANYFKLSVDDENVEDIITIDSKESLEENKELFTDNFYSFLNNAITVLEDKKAQLVDNIMNNPKNTFKVEVLEIKSLNELISIDALASDVVNYSLANKSALAKGKKSNKPVKGLAVPKY